MTDSGRKKKPPTVVWFLLAGWVVVTIVAVGWAMANSEKKLRAGAERTLAAADFDLDVRIEGRDAVITGSVGAGPDIEAARRLVDDVAGVRNVTVDIDVRPLSAAVAEVRPATIGVRINARTIVLSGLVPDQATETALVAQAVTQFGAEREVTSGLSFGDDVDRPDWLSDVAGIFAELVPLRVGAVEISSDGIVISGEVSSEADRIAVEEGVIAALAEPLPVENRLVIADLTPSNLTAAAVAGELTVSGVVPTQDIVDRINTAAVRNFGSDGVNSTVTVGDAADAPWLGAVDTLLDVAAGLDEWTLSIADGELRLAGFGATDAVVTDVRSKLRDVAPSGLTIITKIEIDPQEVAANLTALLASSATFEVGSSVLSAAARPLLDSAVEILVANPSTSLVVEGHTDGDGDPASNKVLSQERADAIVAYLVAGGVPAGRLTAVGYGEERPVADNSTPEGRALNRRIAFVAEKGEG